MMWTEKRRLVFGALLAVAGMAGATVNWAQESFSGAGAATVAPAFTAWSDTYARTIRTALVKYQGVGSSAGIRAVTDKSVDFGASDLAVGVGSLQKAGLVQFPIAAVAIVPVVNIPGVGAGKLRLTGYLLGEIYLGRLTRWDDPRIRKINPGLALPSLEVSPVYRSENSGTTWIFTRYLSKVHDGWRREFGAQTSPKWKAGKGAEAGAGVAKEVLGKAGTIGYVEYGVAKSDNLAHVQLRNLHGRYIVAEPQSFEAAVESQNWGLISVGRSASIDAEFLDAPGGQSWPIVAFNYVVMPKVQLDAKRGRVLLQFLDWSLRDYGDDLLSDLGLVKLSRELDQVIRDFLQANILDNLGAAVWTQAGGAATK